ncbi:hypothetical protein [Streptomyces bicolor]|uniref:hypothetical protein n=1 Tax=Streptomyces bicolor TaxID=66874 RepID=UPI0005641E72|nr:hypothetical protein [Streptomyces bicolor]
MAASGSLGFQERAEFDASSPGSGEDAVAAGRIGGEPGVQVVPEEVAEPALGDSGQVDDRAAVADPDAAELGVNESGNEGTTSRRTVVDAKHLQSRIRKVGRILSKVTVLADDVIDAEVIEDQNGG